jgi:dynein heavy chain
VEVDQDRLERIDVPSQASMWRKLLFNLCFLHSVVQERRKFGPLGWCVPYEYNSGDLRACILFLEKHLYAGPISWPTFQYMVSEAQYGGKITDDLDRRMFNTYASWLVCPAVLEDGFAYNPAHPIAPIPDNFQYVCMDELEIDAYRTYATSFPEIDSPEIFGLHPNADLTFRVKEVTALLTTLGETQPKATGGGSGRSLDEIVVDKCNELLDKMPDNYVEDDYVQKIRRLGGMGKPLNVFLYQEIQRFQNVLARARTTLKQIKLAVNGEVVMTTELVDAMQDIFNAQAPRPWLYTPGGDEFSWLLPNLGQWFTSLLERDGQLRNWLENKPPNSYWMTGFSNPQGFLTAMQQEVTRLHKREGWALDNVTYHTEVTDMMTGDQVREPAEEGVFVHGLWLDGGRWGRKQGSLVESEPKKLFAALPVLWITTLRNSLIAGKKDVYSPTGLAPYMAPVYRYPTRTDRYLVVTIPLPTKTEKADHWTLRGVAVLCITQQ